MTESEKLKRLVEIIIDSYDKDNYNDDCNTSCSCDSYRRVFDCGASTGESRLAFYMAKEIGLKLDEPTPYENL